MQKLIIFLIGVLMTGCNRPSNEPDIKIEDVWSRPITLSETADTSGELNAGYNGSVYLKIKNTGGVSDRLIRAKTSVCAVTEIHKSFKR
jgi:copper(I)-binding protein